LWGKRLWHCGAAIVASQRRNGPFNHVVECAGAKLKRARVIDVEFISSHGRTRHWKRRLTAADKRKFQSLRERKLNGEELDFSDWRSLIEQARAVRDSALPRLMRSKLSPQPRKLRR
jgi:hypothetical protein